MQAIHFIFIRFEDKRNMRQSSFQEWKKRRPFYIKSKMNKIQFLVVSKWRHRFLCLSFVMYWVAKVGQPTAFLNSSAQCTCFIHVKFSSNFLAPFQHFTVFVFICSMFFFSFRLLFNGFFNAAKFMAVRKWWCSHKTKPKQTKFSPKNKTT